MIGHFTNIINKDKRSDFVSENEVFALTQRDSEI
jgi:hypothetical protein